MSNIEKAIDKAASASVLAHEKIAAQRAKLATIATRDAARGAEEEVLRLAVEFASLADETLTALLDKEEAENA